jgi:hypothetical protein
MHQVGHTIQSGVNSACDRQVLRVDVGMSRGCGNGTVEVLEILNDNQVVRLSETRGTQVLDSPEIAAAAAGAAATEGAVAVAAAAGGVSQQQHQQQKGEWVRGSMVGEEQRGLMLTFLQGMLGVAGAANASPTREEGKGEEGGRKMAYGDRSPA